MVALDLECLDRIYLNAYVPNLQVGGQVVSFLTAHLGNPIPSPAIFDKIATPLGVSLERAAWGIHEVINEDVARAFRVHASERGVDYRRCAMVAFGGSGPLHAMRVARKLRIPRVVCPWGAGVMSAFGLLTSPIGFELVRSRRIGLEGLDAETVSADFHSLGMGVPLTISASHGQGCEDLMEHVLAGLEAPAAEDDTSDAIRIAIIGRPNVGKSTLVNRLLGEERVIASDEPGPTRDSILVPFHRDDRDFLLIDTAGLRRRSKVDGVVERASVVKTLQAIAEAHVVVLVLDAHDTVSEQDASVLGIALQRGRALIIAINTANMHHAVTSSDAAQVSAITPNFVFVIPRSRMMRARTGNAVMLMAIPMKSAKDKNET